MRKIMETCELEAAVFASKRVGSVTRLNRRDAPNVSELGDFFGVAPAGNLLSLPSGSRQCAHSAPSLTASQSGQLAQSSANPAQLCTSGEAKRG